MRGRGRRVRDLSRRILPKEWLNKGMKVMSLRVQRMGKGCYTVVLRLGYLIYLPTEQNQSGGSRESTYGFHRPRCDSYNILN